MFIEETRQDGWLYETGDAKNPFDMVAFTRDIDHEIQSIFAPQFAAIRAQAEFERELLRRDFKILELSLTLAFRDALDRTRQKMDQALERIKDDLTEEGLKTLRREMREAIIGAQSTMRDGMIVPLYTFGKSRDERIEAYEDWFNKHYGL